VATLRMPDRLARELVAYCIDSAAPARGDDLLRMLISALGDLPIESAHIVTEDDGCHRYADVVVHAAHAEAFRALFPGAARLRASRGATSVFRLAGSSSRAPQ
jgi:hypothetical protein